MATEENASKRGYSKLSLVAAAAACLWPAFAVAGPPNPTGSDANQNTAAGFQALANVTGNYNTAIGAAALVANTTGAGNTASGRYALYTNTGGNYNTATGLNVLFSNTSGGYNTATGVSALFNNTTGDSNTATGYDALSSNINGTRNTATGVLALLQNTSGNYNTATGDAALYSNTIGGANVADGAEALYANTTGVRSTALGYQALKASKAGSSNVAIGYNALTALTSGGNNLALGTNAGGALKSGSNNIYIGISGVSSESNVTRIGRTQTKVFIKGIAGIHVSGASVVINSAGQLGVVTSSARYKQDIKPLGDVSERLTQLRPVSFSYKTEPGAMHYGLIAEEVDKVMPELVVRDEQNRPESVQYLELIPLLLQERQEMQAELADQRALIEQQRQEMQAELDNQRLLLELQAETLAALRRTFETRLAALGKEDFASLNQ